MKKITVFTTRADTIFGATYMVISVDHPLIEKYSDRIKNIDEMTQKYAQRYEEFYQRFCSIDDGQASKRACEAVFK